MLVFHQAASGISSKECVEFGAHLRVWSGTNQTVSYGVGVLKEVNASPGPMQNLLLQKLPAAVAGKPMTVRRLIASLNAALTPDMSVICDVGNCLFAALDLRVHERTHFLASVIYTSMVFAIAAALGAQIAVHDLRPLFLVGNGALQMTGTELSRFSRLGLDPVVRFMQAMTLFLVTRQRWCGDPVYSVEAEGRCGL
jgi:hypothetical protein